MGGSLIKAGVSGAAGRMGSLVCEAVDLAPDMELSGRYAPGHGADDPNALSNSDVVVEFGGPDSVMDNLALWREFGADVIVGTSGFDDSRLEDLRALWRDSSTRCLVVPNFSVGAVLMMWIAEKVAPYFSAAEVVELHHDRKADAPSGTALSTAARISPSGSRAVDSRESLPGARGAEVAGVWIHSIRLPGLLAHQEVLMGNPGEVLTIRHDTTDRTAFVPGILLAIRSINSLDLGVTVGLEGLMGL